MSPVAARDRCSVNVPNFGDFADPRTVATVAVAAEQAGWDALVGWDHAGHVKAPAARGLYLGTGCLHRDPVSRGRLKRVRGGVQVAEELSHGIRETDSQKPR